MDLSTQYLGLKLDSPFVASSSPLSKNLDSARQLEDYGASALVMYSLFQEQIEETRTAGDSADISGNLLGSGRELSGRDQYLEQYQLLKNSLDIPVIPSLNGSTPGNWVGYARDLEAAGAPALELNIYYVAADISETAESVEHRVLDIFHALKEKVSIPIGVKLSPYFSSPGHVVKALEADGAGGVILFNRFYQPNIDLETLEMSATLQLSTSDDALLVMRWIAILHGQVNLSLAATGGIHFAEDALKALLCGADVTYLGSALLANGPKHLVSIRQNTTRWLAERGYESLTQIKGMLNHTNCSDPASFERGYYRKILDSYKVK